MKLITRDTDYAIRAICYIAKSKGRPVSADHLVRSQKIPRAFLRKILQTLSKRKILHSLKGKGGGFLLNMPSDKIYLSDIMNIFQKRPRLNECVFKKRICPNTKRCILRKKIIKIEEYVFSQIDRISMASLLQERIG
jgi:Rrf2 family protein